MPLLNLIGEPRPFADALEAFKARFTLPTSLSSSEIAGLDASIRSRAFFSARVANAQILQGFRDGLDRLIKGVSPGPGEHTSPATLRVEFRKMLDSLDYRPQDPRDEGTIKDLRSDRRLNVIIRTNEEMAKGYGQYLQDIDPDTIDVFPAWELVRVRPSVHPRDWRARWEEAMTAVGDDGARAAFAQGRMVARKDSPIWTAISRFGVPHPPFDYNSGMGVREVLRKQAIALGVITPNALISAPVHPRDDGRVASVADLDADIRDSLVGSLGPGYQVDGDGVLRSTGEGA